MKQCKHNRSNSWWMYDAKGIEVGRVCSKCEARVKVRYRPEVTTDANYDHCEELEEG